MMGQIRCASEPVSEEVAHARLCEATGVTNQHRAFISGDVGLNSNSKRRHHLSHHIDAALQFCKCGELSGDCANCCTTRQSRNLGKKDGSGLFALGGSGITKAIRSVTELKFTPRYARPNIGKQRSNGPEDDIFCLYHLLLFSSLAPSLHTYLLGRTNLTMLCALHIGVALRDCSFSLSFSLFEK